MTRDEVDPFDRFDLPPVTEGYVFPGTDHADEGDYPWDDDEDPGPDDEDEEDDGEDATGKSWEEYEDGPWSGGFAENH